MPSRKSRMENPFWKIKGLPDQTLKEDYETLRKQVLGAEGNSPDPEAMVQLIRLSVEVTNRYDGPDKPKKVASTLAQCERALSLLDPKTDGDLIAHVHLCKGLALRLDAAFYTGSKKKEKLEKIIRAYHLALDRFKPDTHPADFATVCYYLAYATLLLVNVQKDQPKPVLLKKARGHFLAALPLFQELNSAMYKKTKFFLQGIDVVLPALEKK